MLFKDLSLETSFFGVLLIVLPFRKALVSTVQMAPRYGPQIQWFLHSGYQNLAKKKFETFLSILRFFFRAWHNVTQDKRFGPLKRNLP